MNTNIEISNVLKEQLKKGSRATIGDAVDFQTEYDDKDVNIMENIITDILISNGYKKPTNEDFYEKINIIFKRKIDYSSQNPTLYVNLFNKCNTQKIYYKNKCFISELLLIPEVIDYQKEYPEIDSFEKELSDEYMNSDNDIIKIVKWKNISDLAQERQNNIQTLVNRNKYLFNDNKASFVWLKLNDTYFLESLVTTFGYTKDKDLLDWVMRRNHSKAQEFINNYIFVRNCKGELEIREDILKYIEQTTTDNEDNQAYAKALYYYETYENPNKWSEKEVYKILAYKANTYDYLFMKHRSLGLQSSGRWNILGNIFYYSEEGERERWKKIEENFKANNYYNLPRLKEVLEYAYGFESVGATD